MLEVRRARPDEWQELRDLRLEALQDSPDAFWTRYEEALGRTDQEWRDWVGLPCHVAARDGHLVGMVAAVLDADDPAVATLIAMFVTATARGRGIGAALIEAQLKWARVEGCAHVALAVNVENEPAFHLYERLGFRDTGRRGPLRNGPHVLATMVCDL